MKRTYRGQTLTSVGLLLSLLASAITYYLWRQRQGNEQLALAEPSPPRVSRLQQALAPATATDQTATPVSQTTTPASARQTPASTPLAVPAVGPPTPFDDNRYNDEPGDDDDDLDREEIMLAAFADEATTGPTRVALNENPEFTGQPLEANPSVAAGNDTDTVNADLYDDETEEDDADDLTYFPPTDPVVGLRTGGNLAVVNGFAPTDEDAAFAVMDELMEPGAYADTIPGDEDDLLPADVPGDDELRDAVRQQLRSDATTQDLAIHVRVHAGSVTLLGTVPSLADAENAEDVVSRVRGVSEVLEELDIAAL